MSHVTHPCRTATSQQGSVLLEGLISILIFSFGILAIAGLQGTTINTSRDAKFRNDAAFLANQMSGYVWTDRNNGGTNNIAAYGFNAGAATCAAGAAAPGAPANLVSWLADVAATLPQATANRQRIVVGANNLVTITVCWRSPQDATYHSHTVTTQING
ncbi:MAG: type IV pilus modification protein PilV [Pseudomonadota bacterium]